LGNLCAASTESEVISLMTKGAKREVIATSIASFDCSQGVLIGKSGDTRDDVVFAAAARRTRASRASGATPQ